MTRADVQAADMLFATLDPTLRALTLPHGGKAMLSDTVGFISNLPTQLVAAFRATLESFRRLAPDELGNIKPSRIAVVEAGAGDTPESLAAHMNVPDRPLDTFRLLNGLEPSSGLQPGEHYKIVVN